MTLNEVITALAKTPRDWELTNEGWGPMRIRRGSSCPISALDPRGPQEAGAYHRVADALGIAPRTKLALARAADGRCRRDNKLRLRLLKACGLSE